jgi:uncharacterized DUF497 family protein
MRIEFDPAKSERNERERDLPFERVADFDFLTAVYRTDDRREYGEVRMRALGWLEDRLHALVFTPIDGGIRVISFRKANRREMKKYAQESQS